MASPAGGTFYAGVVKLDAGVGDAALDFKVGPAGEAAVSAAAAAAAVEPVGGDGSCLFGETGTGAAELGADYF